MSGRLNNLFPSIAAELSLMLDRMHKGPSHPIIIYAFRQRRNQHPDDVRDRSLHLRPRPESCLHKKKKALSNKQRQAYVVIVNKNKI